MEPWTELWTEPWTVCAPQIHDKNYTAETRFFRNRKRPHPRWTVVNNSGRRLVPEKCARESNPIWERHWFRIRFRLDRALQKTPPRVVFLHIPKCGGTTVNRHFKWNFGNGRSGMLAEIDSMRGADESALARARDAQFVCGHHGWSTLQAVDADAIRFTVVREPFERLSSLYRFARAHDYVDHPVFNKVFACAKAQPFEGFCLSRDADIRALIDNAQARTLAHDYFPFREQDRTRLIRDARSNLEALDFVIDQRDLDTAIPLLAARTGTRVLRSPRRLNETPRRADKVMSREAFLRDRGLSALIAQDLDVYDHAQGLALGAGGRRRAPPVRVLEPAL